MSETNGRQRVGVAVVGGGQAGLATAYHLAEQRIDHVVLEAGGRIGESWRSRWESLRLFTPAQYDGLPGLPFPAATGTFPTKNEMAGYLEAYAERFALPVRLNAPVRRLTREGDRFLLVTPDEVLEADKVVVASGAFQTHRVPAFAADLDPGIRQVHAGDYRNPDQVLDGPVLVVGAGNSGAEIAMELAQAGHRTFLAGRSTGHIPAAAYAGNGRVFWFIANRVLSVSTPAGRRLRPKALAHGGPLIRLTMKDVVRAGVERGPRVAGVRDGLPLLDGGQPLEVTNVVWCTGFGHDFSWVDMAVFGNDGSPEHERGVVASQPGLYFVGLPFLTKLASAFIGGVGEDARRLVERIGRRLPAEADPTSLGVESARAAG